MNSDTYRLEGAIKKVWEGSWWYDSCDRLPDPAKSPKAFVDQLVEEFGFTPERAEQRLNASTMKASHIVAGRIDCADDTNVEVAQAVLVFESTSNRPDCAVKIRAELEGMPAPMRSLLFQARRHEERIFRTHEKFKKSMEKERSPR
jgi:hypothetical protein